MTITIKLKTDNAAFEDDPAFELSRIFGVLSSDFRAADDSGAGFIKADWNGYTFMDRNGNSIGSLKVTGR